MSNTIVVTEMFVSIQGESTRAGMPCGFIRLSGCNVRCLWCDTAYAFGEGAVMTLDAILAIAQQWPVSLVEITGGEPLYQANTPLLANMLVEAGFTVMVETNGTLPIHVLSEGVVRIMDIKCPGSGMHEHMYWPNIESLTQCDEVKFVLASRTDYDWALETVRRTELARKCGAILLAPVSGRLDARTLAEWIIQDAPPVRLQVQAHKYIWPPDMRGV